VDKPKTLKVVTIEGEFMELPAARAYQQGRGEGGSIKIAASRAIVDLFRKPALKARRITAARLTLSVGSRVIEGTNGSDQTR
jgi:hypothetical protein